MDTLLEPLLY